MTRREAREHCFKMLFCQDFYPAEEKEEQLERYFDAPVEDITGKDGADDRMATCFSTATGAERFCFSTSTIRSPCARRALVSASRSEPNCAKDCTFRFRD